MEPLTSACLTTQTDIINVENVECRTPSPVTSCAGSDCSISTAKVVAATEAAVKERNDVMLRLMSHLIPGASEECLTSETDSSILSSASTLRHRLNDLQYPSEAVKLADRVAALNRRIRKERDLYLHLQGLSNRIDEKDEGDLSTTDSTKTTDSTSNRHCQGQLSNARARRRERLKFGSAMSQRQISSDLQICSPGLSSPEPLTLREIREDRTEEMDQFPSVIQDRYCFENDSMTNLRREKIAKGLSRSSINQDSKITDEMINSCQNASKFSNDQSYENRNFFSVVSEPKGIPRVSNSVFNKANYFKDDLTNCHVSSEAENPHVRATTSSTASSIGADYSYVIRKKIPMKFGGYRPSSELVSRNLSSDSESDAGSKRIFHRELQNQQYRRGSRTDLQTDDAGKQELQDSQFISKNCSHNSDRMTEVEPFHVEKIEIFKDGLRSPVLSADSGNSFEDSSQSQRIETCPEVQIPEETGWALIPPDERDRQLDNDIEDIVKQKTLINFPQKNSRDNLPSLPSNQHSLYPSNFSKMSKSSAEDSGITNYQPVPVSVRSLPECIGNSENLRNRGQDHGDDLADKNVQPEIPPLEFESQEYSQSQSLSSGEKRDETTRSSLDVNALIQALSDVSLKQRNPTNRMNPSMVKLKSPLGYGNRFSESSGPRSSEYTPAPGGSRQSLTSLEVSETHSVRISKGELTARRQYTPSLKSDEQSARSASRTPEIFENSSRLQSNINKSPIVKSLPIKEQKLEFDLSQGSSFIPVVAKVNRTNLVCPKHPLQIKSISKLISPRKYRNTDSRGEVNNLLTSRTEVSQSSEGSRKSFRSLKSVQPATKVHGKKIDGLKPKMETTNLSAPLSGRRVLEPLNLVPKIQPDLLIVINRKSDRRKKVINDLSEISNSRSKTGSERRASAVSSRSSSRTSPISRTNRNEVSSGGRTPRKSSNNASRPSTGEEQQLLKNLAKGKKYPGVSSEKSSVTLGNVLHHRSEELSMSSGDYEEKINWSPYVRDEDLTENFNTCNSEDKSYDQQERANACDEKISGVMDLDKLDMRLSNFTANSLAESVRNCVHVNDLQDGREVSLTCGNSKCQEISLRKTELFKRLPDEISSSLTRHSSFGTQATANLNSSNATPSTFEGLRKNIQENNDRWIKDFKSDDDFEDTLPKSADEKVSSDKSPLRYGKSQPRNLVSNPTKIPLVVHHSFHFHLPLPKTVENAKTSCSRSCVSPKIDSGMSDTECLSPFYKYGEIRRESEYDSEPGQLDSRTSSLVHSGTNSNQNTYRSVAESTDSATILKIDETLSRRDFSGRMDTLNTSKEKIAQKDSTKNSLSVNPSVSTSETDEHDGKTPNLSTNAKSNPDNVLRAVELENCMIDTVESPQSKRDSDKKWEQKEGTTTVVGSDEASGFGVSGKLDSPSSTRSAKSQAVVQHHQDGIISSPVSIKSFSSMSKLNSSADTKWEVTIMTGANSVKKSQDRFPFTISESASRKTSRFKVVADVSLDQLLQNHNTHAESNDAFLSQKPIQINSGDKKMVITDTVNSGKQVNRCEEIPVRQLTPFSEEFTNEVSNDSPDNWNTEVPFIGSNYMSYGCREEPRTLMPTVKEMVKKLSAKLRRTRTKRSQDPEETKIEILYRNEKCRFESGEGSSSAASLYQSQLLRFLQMSNDDSRASSGKKIKPQTNHECISMSIQHSPRKACDQDDLWIQEFDSDVEFDTQESEIAYRKMPNDKRNAEAMPRTSSPVNDRYSMFLARRKLPGIINDSEHNERSRIDSVLNCSEGGDNEKVNFNRRPGDVDAPLIEVREMVFKSPRTPANSLNDDTDEFQMNTKNYDFEDSTAKSGCCCFRIYKFFINSGKHRAKQRPRMKVFKKK